MAMDTNSSLCSTNRTMTCASQWSFHLVMIIIYSTITAFTVVVLSLVVAAKAVRGTIRFILANILVASISTSFGTSLIFLRLAFTSINLNFFSNTDVSYNIFLAIMAIGGNGRSAFMAVFAVVVVGIIKCSNSAVRFKYLIVSVVVVWTACVQLLLSPEL